MIVSDELQIHGRWISWPTLGYCNHGSSVRVGKTRKLWVITAVVLNTYVPNIGRKCQSSSHVVLFFPYLSDIPGGTYAILTWDMVACLLLRSVCFKYRALRLQCKGSKYFTSLYRRILSQRCQIFINVKHVSQWNQKHYYKTANTEWKKSLLEVKSEMQLLVDMQYWTALRTQSDCLFKRQ